MFCAGRGAAIFGTVGAATGGGEIKGGQQKKFPSFHLRHNTHNCSHINAARGNTNTEADSYDIAGWFGFGHEAHYR